MKVGVFVPYIPDDAGGASTFVNDVLRALATVPCGHEFHLLFGGATPPAGGAGLPARAVHAPAGSEDFPIDDAGRELGLHLVWFLTPKHPLVQLPFLTTVWDLEHRNQPYFPEVSASGWTWEQREQHYRTVLPRAAGVVVGTQEGKRQLERYYGIRPSLVTVASFITPTISHEETADNGRGLVAAVGVNEPFVFYPAQFWPHKNHVVLLRALAQLPDSAPRVDLVLTGADRGNLGHVKHVAQALGIADRIHYPGFVDRNTLVALYQHALALVFPSFFGPDNLPPLEAFSLGCPVLAAQVTGADETIGQAATLLDPTDASAWAAAITALLDYPERRNAMIERGLERRGQHSGADYVTTISARLDEFAHIRSCWSESNMYVHDDGQVPRP